MATKTKKKKKSSNPTNLTLAEAMADLNVGPQVSEVKGLFDQAKSQYAEDVASAHAGGESSRAFANLARPTVQKDYDEAASGAVTSNAVADAAFGGVDATDPFKAALLRERATAGRQAGESKAAALQGLTDRVQQAASGEQYAINQARGEYGKTKATLSSKIQDLLGQRGNLVTTELGKLNTADQTAAEKGGDIYTSGAFNGMTKAEVKALSPQQRADIVTAFNKKGPKAGPKNRASRDDIKDLTSDFSTALSKAKDYDARGDAATELVQGVDDAVDKNGHRIPNSGVKAIDQFPVSLALDMKFDGRLSAQNIKRLHDLGFKVSDIPGAIGGVEYKKKLAKARAKLHNRPKAPTGSTGGSPFT
jgi:hypothetical protein